MFFRYKKIILVCSLSIWSLLIFIAGVSYGSPHVIVSQKEIPSDQLKMKKMNEEVIVKSQTEGEMTYTVKNITYTAQKQLLFQIDISKMTSFNYLVFAKDIQNQDLNVKEYRRDEKQNSSQFQVEIPEALLNSDIYICVYPVSEEAMQTRKVADKGYGKTVINIPTVRQQTIDQLK